MLNLPYITWRELPPTTPGGKPRKVPHVPHDPRTAQGYESDPHDPTLWMTKEQCDAAIASHPQLMLKPGMVLSDNDPYFLLDLDDCYDGTNWHPGVNTILGMFPGAAVEVSINGKGLHIIGQCQSVLLGERRNKFDLYGVACEFYHTKRFIACGHGFQGEPNLDHTAMLQQFVPVREMVTTLSLIDQADPEWSGPEDDDQLINIMLNSKGSTAQMFGDKASVADLWTANVAALAKSYPSASGDQFDRSSADAALMAHLAFWTGKNTDRMDRLFRRSALLRDKYEKRSEYQMSTISGAVAHTKNVYKQSAKSAPKQDIVLTTTESGDTAFVSQQAEYGEIMSIEDQNKFFDGCVYVAQEHAVLMTDGRLLKPQQFKTVMGGHCFLMSADGSRPSFNAFEAFTENRATSFPKVNRTRFKPGVPFGAPVGSDGVNVYKPPQIESYPGDVSRLLELLQKILPDDRDREIFLSWIAAVVQYPGVKFLWSPVLQGTKGNGKSIWAEILTYCVGEQYAWTPKAKKIDAQFNAFLRNRVFINIEEMSMFGKIEMLETLKDYITSTRQEVEKKGVDSEMDSDYCANWYFATNHKDAIIKERDDRRFAVFFSAQQTRDDVIRAGMLTDNYFPKLWHWLKNEGGFAMAHHFLMNHPINPEFNPAGNCIFAPVTTSTEAAIAESFSVAEQYIIEEIESETPGFRGGWISTFAITKLLRDNGQKAGPKRIKTMLEGLGYELRCRASRPLMHEENAKPRLYALPNITGDLPDYEKAQGYA